MVLTVQQRDGIRVAAKMRNDVLVAQQFQTRVQAQQLAAMLSEPARVVEHAGAFRVALGYGIAVESPRKTPQSAFLKALRKKY